MGQKLYRTSDLDVVRLVAGSSKEFTLINIPGEQENNQSELVIFPLDANVNQPYGING